MLVSSVIGLVIPNVAVEFSVPFPYTNVTVYSFSAHCAVKVTSLTVSPSTKLITYALSGILVSAAIVVNSSSVFTLYDPPTTLAVQPANV